MPNGNMVGIVGPSTIPQVKTAKVYFTGDTAVKKGMALVYDFTTTVKAGLSVPGKGNAVRVPTSTYKYYFAGVAATDYAAKTGGQWIEIYLPGSICQCLVAPATTAGSTVVVFSQTDGKFGKLSTTSITVASTTATIVSMAESGCGTALALETAAEATADGKLMLCKLLEGTDCVAPSFSAS